MNTMFTDKLRIKDLEETLANSTALHAFVGAGDLAVEKIRAARGELVSRSASFDPKAFREQAQATLAEGVEALQAEVQAAPEQIRSLPEKAQDWPAKAQSLFADVVSTAFSTYGELAGRGKTIITHVRGEKLAVDVEVPVSRPTSSTAKATLTKDAPVHKSAEKPAVKKPAAKSSATKKTATKKSATKRTSAATLAGQTLAAETSTAKSPAARTLASKTSASTPAAKKLAAKTLAAKKTTTKTSAAKTLAARSTSAGPAATAK